MKQKIPFIVICIETALIFFFIFGFIVKINHNRAKVSHFFPSGFSTEEVYRIFDMTDEQKTKYDELLTDLKKQQRENDKKLWESFMKLNRLIKNDKIDTEAVNREKEQQCDIMDKNYSISVDYLVGLKLLLNDDQKKIFNEIMENREMHRIMPPFEFGRGRHDKRHFRGPKKIKHHSEFTGDCCFCLG